MCALLGMDFTQPIFAGFSFREFGRWGEDNADGWGLAWYPDQSAALIKEPIRWGASKHIEFLNNYQQIHARIYLAHVRHRTMGGNPTHADTHPFLRECGGRDYCFAHNGTLPQAGQHLALQRYQPLGATDSERIFCKVLDDMASAGRQQLDDEESWRWLQAKLTTLNALGKLNCLLTDGQRLFCYRDLGGWKGLLYSHVYILGTGPHKFEDPNVSVELAGDVLNRGILVATEPLSGGAWHPMHPGELLVLEGGRPRFSTHRDLGP